MRIAILGCGAMGTVLGAYLTANGCPVDMVDSYQAHVDAAYQLAEEQKQRVDPIYHEKIDYLADLYARRLA